MRWQAGGQMGGVGGGKKQQWTFRAKHGTAQLKGTQQVRASHSREIRVHLARTCKGTCLSRVS